MAEQRDWMLRVAMRLCHDRTEAEEIVQAATVNLLKSADRIRPDSEMRAYVTTLLTNEFLSRCRKQGTVRRALERFKFEPLSAEEVEEVTRESEEHTVDDVKAAIEKLTPSLREPYVLYEFHGLKYVQIAARLGIPLTTVKVRIFRARIQLRRILRERKGADGPKRRGPAGSGSGTGDDQ